MEFDSFAAMALAVTLGAGVQAAIGFAFGLIAAPVLLVAMGSGAAIQVLVVVHLVQSLMLVPRLWHLAPRRILVTLMLASVVGFPIGLLVFLSLDLTALTLAVGISLIAVALLLAAREAGYLHMADIRPDKVPRWATATTGVVTGILTAVLVMPGPPVMILNGWMRMPKDESRALSLTFFAFCYVMTTLLHMTAGGMPLSAWTTVAYLAPFVVVGTLIGTRVAAYLSEGWFRFLLLVVV
ncbi:MAG: sulfite exporter TauE/SafE family protein, partial [Hyphomicrobiaceae bacterium]